MVRAAAAREQTVIRELCEDAEVLQQWTERLGVPYRGQRLEVFLHLLQGKRDDTRSRSSWPSSRACASCAAPPSL